MRVTLEDLRELGACREERQIFAEEWPDGVELTRAALERAVQLDMQIDWWIEEAHRAGHIVYDRYLLDSRRDLADQAYHTMVNKAQDERAEAEQPIWAEYREKRAAIEKAEREGEIDDLESCKRYNEIYRAAEGACMPIREKSWKVIHAADLLWRHELAWALADIMNLPKGDPPCEEDTTAAPSSD